VLGAVRRAGCMAHGSRHRGCLVGDRRQERPRGARPLGRAAAKHAHRPRCRVRAAVWNCEGYQGRPTHTEDYHKGDEVNCAVVSIRAVGQQRCVLGASEPPR
jgi:hypothetical protein